eukprot:1380343-Pyramimonas_sp.AAC.1
MGTRLRCRACARQARSRDAPGRYYRGSCGFLLEGSSEPSGPLGAPRPPCGRPGRRSSSGCSAISRISAGAEHAEAHFPRLALPRSSATAAS